jgi:hypothetical protein
VASQTSICNRALEKLGESPIVSLSDNLDQAKALKRVYVDSLNALIAEHPWHFAKKRAALPASATAPAWGFNFAYPVPADFVRLLGINDAPNFSLEADPTGSQAILSDAAAPLKILYLYNVSDAGRLPPHFVEAFSSKLALDICEDITQSNTKKDILAQLFTADLAKAKRINGLQKAPDAFPTFSWLASRDQNVTLNPILTTDGA